MATPPLPQRIDPPLSERDHVLGPGSAGLELIEYGDFECPQCGAAYPVVGQLRTHFGEELRFAFRHFPLISYHVHAHLAAQAAEAAGAQGRFWEMCDLLYTHQLALEMPHLAGYARELGLDLPRFQEELATGRYAQRVQDDLASGLRSGVRATPGFFINGLRYRGAYDFTSLAGALRQAGAVAASSDPPGT